jgi:hypothetical protein
VYLPSRMSSTGSLSRSIGGIIQRRVGSACRENLSRSVCPVRRNEEAAWRSQLKTRPGEVEARKASVVVRIERHGCNDKAERSAWRGSACNQAEGAGGCIKRPASYAASPHHLRCAIHLRGVHI